MNSDLTFSMQTNMQIWRICAWAGPIYLVGELLAWVGLAGFMPPPPQSWTTEQVFQFYMTNNVQIRAGMVGVLFFAPFYMVWSSVISKVIRRVEGPEGMLANIEFMGGLVTSLITSACALPWLLASFRPEVRTAAEVQFAHDLGWLIFDCTFMATTLQLVAFAVVFMLDKRSKPLIPRWLCWYSLALATTFLPILLMPFFNDGPFAWHGLIVYWVALGGWFIWIVPASYYISGAVKRLSGEDGQLTGVDLKHASGIASFS